jgi:uncharacterized protein YbbK (DUF523 family)
MAAEAGQIQEAPSPSKILISACLIGEKVRYDGDHQRLGHPLICAWQASGRLVPCCPEVLGGLPIPRPPAEIIGGDGERVLRGEAIVRTKTGADVTAAFMEGAEAVLAIARSRHIRVAILCQRSPSCGSRQIHNGLFQGTLIPGVGVTTALLKANGIAVFGPAEIESQAFGLYVEP